MTRRKIYSKINSKLTALLEGFKLYKDSIDSLFYCKDINENTVAKVWITVMKMRGGGYETRIAFSVLNRRIELLYHLFNEFNYEEDITITKSIFHPFKSQKNHINNEEDLEKWLEKVEIILTENNLALFETYAKLDELEKLMNYGLKNEPINAFDTLNYQIAEKGIIASWLVNGENKEYELFVDKIFSICEHLSDLGGREYIYTNDFKELKSFLKTIKEDELNVEFLKNKLNARRV